MVSAFPGEVQNSSYANLAKPRIHPAEGRQKTHQRNCQERKLLDSHAVKIPIEGSPREVILLNASLNKIYGFLPPP
jgi:hypothetical protein